MSCSQRRLASVLFTVRPHFIEVATQPLFGTAASVLFTEVRLISDNHCLAPDNGCEATSKMWPPLHGNIDNIVVCL